MFHPIAIKLGYRKSQNKKNELLHNFFGNLIEMKVPINHIVDIGANHGTWSREAKKFFPNAYFTLIEPQEWLKSSFPDLLTPKTTFLPIGVGKQEGSFKFTIVERDDSCSFRFSEEEAKEKNYKQIDIPVKTLNQIVVESSYPTPDMVKIDAEGLDIDVLDGASDLFGKTELFLVEVGIVNNKFGNSAQEVINYMDKKGYKWFEITDLNRPFQPKLLWLAELVFIKKNGIIDQFQLFEEK